MKTIIYGCLSAYALLFLNACASSEASDSGKIEGKAYPVIALEQKDTVLQMDYVAAIEAHKNVELHARTAGILRKIYIEEGQTVRKGQLLFKINDEEAKLNLAKAAAAWKSAVASARIVAVELKRVKALVEKKVVAPSEAELVRARLEAEEAKAEEARVARNEAATLLSYTAVYAPFDGVVDRLPLKDGSLVEKGSLLTTISDIHAMYAYFNISENEYLRLVQAEQSGFGKVSLVLADGSTYEHHGIVKPAESEIDKATGSIAYRAIFPNPERLLKHGATGKLVITKAVEDALLVPQKSVFEIQDKSYVYVAGTDNKVRMKSFTPAHRVGPYYIVASGLTPADQVVYEGVQSLRDGMTIKPVRRTL